LNAFVWLTGRTLDSRYRGDGGSSALYPPPRRRYSPISTATTAGIMSYAVKNILAPVMARSPPSSRRTSVDAFTSVRDAKCRPSRSVSTDIPSPATPNRSTCYRADFRFSAGRVARGRRRPAASVTNHRSRQYIVVKDTFWMLTRNVKQSNDVMSQEEMKRDNDHTSRSAT